MSDNISPLDECYTCEEMAEQLRMTLKSFQNHKLPEVLVRSNYYRIGRRIYVPKKDFHTYIRSHIVKAPKQY